jgi:hypothetical protein
MVPPLQEDGSTVNPQATNCFDSGDRADFGFLTSEQPGKRHPSVSSGAAIIPAYGPPHARHPAARQQCERNSRGNKAQ